MSATTALQTVVEALIRNNGSNPSEWRALSSTLLTNFVTQETVQSNVHYLVGVLHPSFDANTLTYVTGATYTNQAVVGSELFNSTTGALKNLSSGDYLEIDAFINPQSNSTQDLTVVATLIHPGVGGAQQSVQSIVPGDFDTRRNIHVRFAIGIASAAMASSGLRIGLTPNHTISQTSPGSLQFGIKTTPAS